MSLSIQKFQKIVWDFYRTNKRDFPWRFTKDPYAILISEFMLQQTQTARVVEKYTAFLKRFPTVTDVAHARPSDVITLWQGLGYNRRALYLKKAAEKIVSDYGGVVPNNSYDLQTLSGIGPYTSGAILAFAHNISTVCLETNIRRVFLYHFFHDKTGVADSELIPYIEASVDQKNPREWYWALMDYGASLPRIIKQNSNRRSASYVKQSKFEGSLRQVRGEILRLLTVKKSLSVVSLRTALIKKGFEKEKITRAMGDLVNEGFIVKQSRYYRLR